MFPLRKLDETYARPGKSHKMSIRFFGHFPIKLRNQMCASVHEDIAKHRVVAYLTWLNPDLLLRGILHWIIVFLRVLITWLRMLKLAAYACIVRKPPASASLTRNFNFKIHTR